MSFTAASLIAWAGVYVFIAVQSITLSVARPNNPEYKYFAGYAATLTVISLLGALLWEVRMPAQAAGIQSAQMVVIFPCATLFTHTALFLCRRGQASLRHTMNALTALSMMAAASGLLFDPALADPAYDWSVAPGTSRALARFLPLGVGLAAIHLGFAGYGLYCLVRASIGRTDLRATAALASASVLAGAWDLTMRWIGQATPFPLATYAALLSALGFSYVLIGRFIAADVQLERRKEELATSYDHLRRTQKEIVKNEQLAAVGELSAVIAHEVRNPLAIIKNAVAGLRREKIGPEDKQTLLVILDEESDRLNHLIDDLLAYSKPIGPSVGMVDIPRLIGHAVELAASGSRDISQIEIELMMSQPCPPIQGDEALLRHALINIADNALQAMPNGGTLTVSCRTTQVDGGPHIAIEFHDTGEGMDTLVRTHARDPFFTTRQSGTGLGLAMVDRVARAHGGQVDIESRHGQGTTVSLIIPTRRQGD